MPTPQVYELPRRLVFGALAAFVMRRKRSPWADAIAAIDGLAHQPVVCGMDHVPMCGPVVFVPNHYERKDAVWVGWGAMALTASLAHSGRQSGLKHMHWVMTDTWADCFVGPVHLDPRYLSWVLKAFSNIYGIIRMPAHDLPTHDALRGRSAGALLELVHALNDGDCVAVHPEAGGFETLITPPKGSGRVFAYLARLGVPIVPVGIYEEDDRLHVNIGEPLDGRALACLADGAAATMVMCEIANLVPLLSRGVYAGTGTIPVEPKPDLTTVNVGVTLEPATSA